MPWIKLSLLVNLRVEADDEVEALSVVKEILKQTSGAYDGIVIHHDSVKTVEPDFVDEDDEEE